MGPAPVTDHKDIVGRSHNMLTTIPDAHHAAHPPLQWHQRWYLHHNHATQPLPGHEGIFCDQTNTTLRPNPYCLAITNSTTYPIITSDRAG